MTDAVLLASVLTASELQDLRADCVQRILDGKGQLAFVTSSSISGKSVTLSQTYSVIDMLRIVKEAIDYNAGTRNPRVTYPVFNAIGHA